MEKTCLNQVKRAASVLKNETSLRSILASFEEESERRKVQKERD